MSLGRKLAETIENARIAGIRADDLANEQRRAEIEKKRRAHIFLVDTIKKNVVEKVEAGLVPKVKVESYDDQTWLRSAQGGKARNQDVFDGLTEWAAENEISLRFTEDHDGGGMKNWITVRVVPVEPEPSPEL